MNQRKPQVAVIGAGPAGLTAAYVLARHGIPVTVLEQDPQYVGGISRTAEYKGFLFDIGGHRFFSKSREIEQLWSEILPADMLDRPRSSRIYYRGRFFSYPLHPIEALYKLGLIESLRCTGSYLWAKLFPVAEARTFEDYVANQFGRRLYEVFFKTYTEKVWGMSCQEISADWAAQRIKDLSLASAILNAVMPRQKNGHVIKTLIDRFRYPRRGPGMLWEACAAKVRELGGEIRMGTPVDGLRLDEATKRWTVSCVSSDGGRQTIEADHVISSAPMRELMQCVAPEPREEALAAARGLRYRDFLVVVLIVRDEDRFGDNWIYIHDPGVKVGRIQNFKAWSPEMVPDPACCSYGLEYFCFEGDGLWESSDGALIERAKHEMHHLGLLDPAKVTDGCVVRQKKAYPVYDENYHANVNAIREELSSRYPGLHVAGRNGMHKYDNQDHAMMTAWLTARNIIEGETQYDVWRVNQDAQYLEGGAPAAVDGLRSVPGRAAAAELGAK